MTDADTDASEIEAISGSVLTDAADPRDTKPWTVKGMPEWVIDLARTSAKAERMSMGEWLTKIIPLATGEAAARMPEVHPVPTVFAPKAATGLPDLAALSQTAEVAKRLSEIGGLPKSVLREVHGLLRDRLKTARLNSRAEVSR